MLRALFCLKPSCFNSVPDLCTSLASVSHSFASQLCSDLRSTISWLNAVGQIQEHEIDLHSCASLTKSASLPESAPEIGGPILSITYTVSGLFLFFLLYTYISCQSASLHFSYNNFTLTCSCWSGLRPLTASSL